MGSIEATDVVPRLMKLHIDNSIGLARVKFNGVITPNSVIDAVMQILSHPEFKTNMPSLWDYRECDFSAFNAQDLRRIGDVAHNTVEQNNNARIALLVEGDLQFGLSRMFVMLNEITHLDFQPFRDEEKALQWVLEDPNG